MISSYVCELPQKTMPVSLPVLGTTKWTQVVTTKTLIEQGMSLRERSRRRGLVDMGRGIFSFCILNIPRGRGFSCADADGSRTIELNDV